MRPGIKQPGRFEAEIKRQRKYFSHHERTLYMKKLLIASAVSAAFAAPTVALAQAARAPTLGQVLDASGISMSGYLDVGYTHADRNIQGGVAGNPAVPPRVFDNQNNSFD